MYEFIATHGKVAARAGVGMLGHWGHVRPNLNVNTRERRFGGTDAGPRVHCQALHFRTIRGCCLHVSVLQLFRTQVS